MKLKGFILFIVLFLVIAGCKKTGSDGDLDVCGDTGHKHLENGTCVCDEGWFGWNCDKPESICGPHAQGVENWCECDTGWVGAGCQVPLSSYAGRYHIIGRTIRHFPTNTDTIYIDDTIDITWQGATLINQTLAFTLDTNSAHSTSYYFIRLAGPFGSSSYHFKKVADDSIFYDSYGHSIAASGSTSCAGIKIN